MASAPALRTVFLASDPQTAEALRRTGGLQEAEGVTVDAAYAAARDLDLAVSDDEEEAEFWALTDAALMSLRRSALGPRFVVAARVRPDQLAQAGPEGSGRVTVSSLEWVQVSAIFVDEADALPAVESARAALDDPTLVEDRIALLVAEHDLLWYAPDELDGLLG
ncbi:hypothetical protein GA0111570_105138 [Raineyella antarctica]|uniref:Uncharacterized protein n=1 Tax=Raineyella antarctica TaxID=1577474 RepID=A0A1G6GVF3_9ACTN|nr:hypothetical protein [Raineyella antarctica]SDB85997.1 hypothetical protein GA0111570_105138 [Raineyella antarctica]